MKLYTISRICSKEMWDMSRSTFYKILDRVKEIEPKKELGIRPLGKSLRFTDDDLNIIVNVLRCSNSKETPKVKTGTSQELSPTSVSGSQVVQKVRRKLRKS